MANNIGRVVLFGENIFITAADEPSHNFLRAFKSKIVSKGGGGGILHRFLEEKYFQEHDQEEGAKFCDIHVDKSTSKLSLVDDDVVDTTLKLSNGTAGQFMHCFLQEDFQEHENKGAKYFCTFDDHVDTLTSSKLSVVDDDDDDDGGVDTTLKLSTSDSRNSDPPLLVYCPMPLRCIPPGIIPEADFSSEGFCDSSTVEISTALSLSHAGSRIGDKKRGSKLGKRTRDDSGGEKRRRSVKRKHDNGAADDENSHPIPSLDDIPGLGETIESRNGTKPVFLYRKKLEESDVSGHHNRLFVTRREKFMEFLTAEELTALNQSSKGLEIFAVDQRGKLYKLGLKIWRSLKMMVINSDWNKLVTGNNAQKGDWIEIWGYREKEKLRFAVYFRKSEA